MAAGRPDPPQAADPTSDVQTMRDLARIYLQTMEGVLAPSTLRGHDAAFRRSIDKPLGAVLLRDLTRARVVAWMGDIARRHGRHGTWKATTALRTFLNLAVELKLVPDNPAAGLRLPRAYGAEDARRGSRKALSMAELDRLIAACACVRDEVMIRLSAEAGLRLGEVVGLRWDDIELDSCRMTVARSVWQEPGRNGGPPTYVVKPPKSGKVATVAISASLAERLADLYAVLVVEGGMPADGYVFGRPSGRPMDHFAPGRVLRRTMAKAGLVDADGKPLVSWHGLRHTAATLMLAQGVPLPDVAAQLRHADPSITARVYSHSLGEDRQHAAASVFDDAQRAAAVRDTVRDARAGG